MSNLVRADYRVWKINRSGDWDLEDITEFFHCNTIDQAHDMVRAGDQFNRIQDCVVQWATDFEIENYHIGRR